MDGTIEEKEARRWLKATAGELTGVIAAITNERAKSLRNGLVNAVVLKVRGAAAGAATDVRFGDLGGYGRYGNSYRDVERSGCQQCDTRLARVR